MFNLTINNFRAYKNTSFNISKTNILIGENSGGKTSLIKLLLLLKQSMETPNKDKKINVNGHLLDLGNFDSFINKNSDEKFFSVDFEIDSEEYINFYIPFVQDGEESTEQFVQKCDSFIHDSVKLSFVFKKEDNEFFTNNITISSENIGSISFEVSLEDDNHFSLLADVKANLHINHKRHGKIVIPNKLQIYGFMLLVEPQNIIEYSEENNLHHFLEEMAFLLVSQNFIASILRNIHYINPIKFHPARILLKRDNSFNGKITDFESLVNALSSLKEAHNKESKNILKKFNLAVKELGIADEIKLETNSTIPVSELKVKKAGTWNSIVDVGYGVGLQVPILLQAIICANSKSNHTLIIEQPEIHLHPFLHAKFIDILIKFSGDTKLIIETHSEHIIRKLQVLAKNSIINIEQTNIYYFKNDSGIFEITKHKIIESGQLEPTFPKGFYDNSYNLSKELY
jgi:predicted ATPase